MPSRTTPTRNPAEFEGVINDFRVFLTKELHRPIGKSEAIRIFLAVVDVSQPKLKARLDEMKGRAPKRAFRVSFDM